MIQNTIESYLPSEEVLNEAVNALTQKTGESLDTLYTASVLEYKPDVIVPGTIVGTLGDYVVIDMGYKSEGFLPASEFTSPEDVQIGKQLEVYLEEFDQGTGLINISKKKADGIRAWEKILSTYKEGDIVEGKIIRKVKGGNILDIGVPVFLPMSQLDTRRIEDSMNYVGLQTKAIILTIDQQKRNIIVSRKKYLEIEREKLRGEFFRTVKEGDVIDGVVKNIADYGVFVECRGIDGLLHISDMSWGKIGHPSEIFTLGQSIQTKVLKIDSATQRLNLGYKQLSEDPWTHIQAKYPVGSKVKGKVVNVVSFGAFVQLEPGIEGLVPTSEMSWSRRISHPQQLVAAGDTIEGVVLAINGEKRTITLGMKQAEQDPWADVPQKYPIGKLVKGVVKNITNYGAFITLEDNIDGLVHISDFSWTQKIHHPSEVMDKGQIIDLVVLSVDTEKKRISLGIKQIQTNPWETTIPEKYPLETTVTGVISHLTSYGAYVKLEEGVEGLLGLRKSKGKEVEENDVPSFKVGDPVEVIIKKIEPREGKIGLAFVRKLETSATEPSSIESPDPSPSSSLESKPSSQAPSLESTEISSSLPPAEKLPAPDSTHVS